MAEPDEEIAWPAAPPTPVPAPADSRVAGRFSTAELPRDVLHGVGALARMPGELDRLGVRRVLVLTSRSLGESDVLDEVVGALGAWSVEVFDRCREHTPRSAVEAAGGVVRGHVADTVVCLGGGSVVDTGKQVVHAAAADARPHLVALPTTLAGSEHTSAAALTEPDGTKHVTRDPVMAASFVLLDPALARSTPARLWASSGVKVISDAVEQLCSSRASPLVDVLASQSVAVLAALLPTAGPTDESARLRCQLASWMCLFGMFGADTLGGLAAGLRHQLAARHGLPHGLVGAALLPAALRALLPGAPRVRPVLAAALSARSPSTEDVAAAAEDLLRLLDLPVRLADLELGHDQVADVAPGVFADLVTAGSPLPCGTATELAALFAP